MARTNETKRFPGWGFFEVFRSRIFRVYRWITIKNAQQAVTREASNAGRIAWSHEVLDDPSLENILTPAGFLHAVHQTMRLAPIANSVLAPVCKSWTRINMFSSGRTKWNPSGNLDRPRVVNANLMASRVAVLLWIQSSCGVLSILENPVNSMLEKYFRIDEWIRKFDVVRLYIDLWDFGQDHHKKLWLYCKYKWIKDIKLFKMSRVGTKQNKMEISKNWDLPDGRHRFQGGKDLEATQAYPAGFGRAVQKLFEMHRPDLQAEIARLNDEAAKVDMSSAPLFGAATDKWEDAKLDEVFRILMWHAYLTSMCSPVSEWRKRKPAHELIFSSHP